jgi:hypothetical protein
MKGQQGSQNKHKLTKHKTRNSNRNKSKALQTKQMLSEKITNTKASTQPH